jgi:hypothetical protein
VNEVGGFEMGTAFSKLEGRGMGRPLPSIALRACKELAEISVFMTSFSRIAIAHAKQSDT